MSGHRPLSVAVLVSSLGLLAACEEWKRQKVASEPEVAAVVLHAASPTVPANGSTAVQIEATQANGSPVKDGTDVRLTVTLGWLSDGQVQTQEGKAAVTFRAGATTGTARVTATVGKTQGDLAITVQAPPPAANAPASQGPATPPPSGEPIDLAQVAWIDPDVSRWAVASRVTHASIEDPPICIEHTKAGRWPVVDGAEGNPWIFVNLDGRWHAATFEWLSPGQTCEYVTSQNIGANIGRPPLNSWVPRSGELVGLMVSTHARFRAQATHERSNIVIVRWP